MRYLRKQADGLFSWLYYSFGLKSQCCEIELCFGSGFFVGKNPKLGASIFMHIAVSLHYSYPTDPELCDKKGVLSQR